MTANVTVAADLVPQITIDHVNRLNYSVKKLQELLGVTEMVPVPEGNQIKVYAIAQYNTPDQVAEGEEIALTEIKRTVAKTIDMTLKKYRKLVGSESIQKAGRDVAINMTDDKLISGVQSGIKTVLCTAIKTGTGTATSAATVQAQLANNWAALEAYYEDMDCTPVHFMHPTTAAGYISANRLDIVTEAGMSLVETIFGTIVLSTQFSANDIWSTAKENLNGAYVPVSASAFMDFGLTTDETGLIGMVHTAIAGRAAIETVAMSNVVFYPEVAAGVICGQVNPS